MKAGKYTKNYNQGTDKNQIFAGIWGQEVNGARLMVTEITFKYLFRSNKKRAILVKCLDSKPMLFFNNRNV